MCRALTQAPATFVLRINIGKIPKAQIKCRYKKILLWQIFIVSIVDKSFQVFQHLQEIPVTDTLMDQGKESTNCMKVVKRVSILVSIVD